MMDILAMLKICFSSVASAMLMPEYNLGFMVVLLIIYFQYKKNVRLQEIVYGKPKFPLSNLILTAVLSGIAAGIAVSIPMTLIGISFSQNIGIQYLIVISIILMFVEPRFMCFSYSGGILAIVSLIFGISSIDVTGIMVLVALLHLMESILIFLDGYRGAVPVFMERGDGSIIGGFSMQRFWPVPMALIIFMGFSQMAGDTVATPDWWPVIRPYIEPGRIQEALFAAMPLTAILGHGRFTSSYLPKDKCRDTAFKLLVFSLLLLLLSIISSYIYLFKYIAALFAPIAHEVLIQYDKKQEIKREPLFSSSPEGIRILDTMPEGPGERMGIQPGEVIISINNRSVRTEADINEFFKNYISYIWVDVKNIEGQVRTLEYKNYSEGIDSLEIIYVPDNNEGMVIFKEPKSSFGSLLDRLMKNK